MRYVHKWHTPVVIRIWPDGEPEFVYFAPFYDRKLLPVTEFDNCLAMPYDHVMPVMKVALLGRLR